MSLSLLYILIFFVLGFCFFREYNNNWEVFWELHHYTFSYHLINELLSIGALRGYKNYINCQTMLKILCSLFSILVYAWFG